MNYLAHLTLSRNERALMIGNFIADNIPRKEEEVLPADILEGIQLHRRIDEFTDNHEAFKEGVLRLRPVHRKYAPVVLDILNDHLLALNWYHFHDLSIADFSKQVYSFFKSDVERLPPRASLHVYTLLEYRYLEAYESRVGIEGVLKRMDRRTRFPSNFQVAVDQLYSELDFFNDQFIKLYKDLYDFVIS